MKNSLVETLFGAFGAHFGVIWGGFWVVLGLWGHQLGGRKRTWTHVRQKGGGPISQSPLLARKSGPGSSPGGAQRTRKSAEKTPKKETRGYVKRK